MNQETMERYEAWMASVTDEDLKAQLAAMQNDEEKIEDAFYRHLAFGTGGLRGVLGVGTNRMNIYTVGRASRGLANYCIAHYPEAERKIAVSYDSRIMSPEFAQAASEVFAKAGMEVWLYDRLMPTPCLSYAVRALNCCAGVMITASHNPAQYNGYKVYGADGCQITTEAAAEILKEIDALGYFDASDAVGTAGTINTIPEQVLTDFLANVKAQSPLSEAEQQELSRDAKIVYTPLNGSGREPVLRILKECGYTDVTVVAEQEQPDGHFPTCPKPNPELKETMTLCIQTAEKVGADLCLATDPDCDRVGIAVKSGDGYELLTGNEVGLLLFDYICSRRTAAGRMPEDPVLVKTIVTTDLVEPIAAHYGVRVVNVLTGFKFIGEQIGMLEQKGREDSYIFGFEESYGYLSGGYVRDKDAVDGAYLICEMYAWYQKQGISLIEKLNELYNTYGYCLNTLCTYEFEGAKGFARMQEIMADMRGDIKALGSYAIEKTADYLPGLDGLPSSDVIKFTLQGGASVVVRPSGTEPKLKMYLSVTAADKAAAQKVTEELKAAVEALMA